MWETLKKAFAESDGFTVIFHLTNGQSFNISLREPDYHKLGTFDGCFIRGTVLGSDNEITIPTTAICAYEIEE